MNLPAPDAQRMKDEEHLRLLALFHTVVAGIGALFACLPLVHVGLGLALFFQPEFLTQNSKGAPPPPFVGLFFMVIGGFFVLAGWAAAICTFLSGRYLAQRRRRMFSVVMAAVLCAFSPFGTVLGVFTLLVLSRDSVQRLYAESESRG